MSNELHEKVFEFMEAYRAKHPEFVYWLRERNKNQRLEQGLWFQGNENYAFVGLYDASGGTNMTRSLGLVFWMNDKGISCHFENAFNEEKDAAILSFYDEMRNLVGGFEQAGETKYLKKDLGTNGFEAAKNFLDSVKPHIDQLIIKKNLQRLFITQDDFEKKLKKMMKFRNELQKRPDVTCILANITWNSKDWTEPTKDKSSHRYVEKGGIPAESWNFDFDNPRNTSDKIYGFAQFTKSPKLLGENNLVIFYSQDHIVGFYGKAEVLSEVATFDDNPDRDENKAYNIVGSRDLCVSLMNKITNVKEKGYLEEKKRIGMIGFAYVNKKETVNLILDEAIRLNPDQQTKLQAIKDWFNNSQPNNNTANKEPDMITTFPLNQIFFGPPGTGKTYNTSNEAIRIADPDFYEANKNDRGKLKGRFRELLIKDWKNPQKGRISFCTFHQSFSYEDFIEGIKPVVEKQEEIKEEDSYLKYEIEDGIFKKLADRARYFASSEAKKDKQRISLTDEDFNSTQFYKVSLGNISIPEDQAIYDYCIENDLISVGFLDDWDLAGKTESELYKLIEGTKLSRFEPQAMNYFIHYLKTGNYVLISKGKDKVRAIGKVTGDYFHNPDAPINYTQFRKVEWIIKNADIPVEEIYQKSLMQQTIYKLNKDWVNKEFFVHAPAAPVKEEQPNYVLIIDEINRGNISQIFGELITLIEDDKREGKPEQLEVTLPYSKEKFSVPANLHIIGTMNTADRSIEALDTALRRRFTFVEMAPQSELIAQVGKSNGEIEGIDLVKLLATINERIEKLIDKDHQIGHSYFLDIATFDELKIAFINKVIPLLEEYFYGDFGKIGLVLGSSFVIPKKKDDFSFADFKGFDDDIITDLKERKVFEITDSETWTIEDFIWIYQK